MYLLELTEEELDFIYERCQRKAMRLEEAHLKDIPCYTHANRIIWKIHDLKNPPPPLTRVEISQADYDELRSRGFLEENTIYFIKEKET
jgi:hypothetical protein